MPVYSFACKKCGEEFTKLVSIREKDQVTCPHCGERELRQLFGRFNYVKITKKYNPGCNVANNCLSAKKYGCGKYAKDPVPIPRS
jgi:putative FmdB family regulatory protein